MIVDEFFDIGLSRAIPWKRRPQAARLLEALKRPDRGFDAVVIGEPQRAFYGNQFGLTFPLFVHYGVAAVGARGRGAIDPGSDAHDLVMALYGGMTQGRTEPDQDPGPGRDGLPGRRRGPLPRRPPAVRVPAGRRRTAPQPGQGRRRPAAAPARTRPGRPPPSCARIFTEYLAGTGLYAIAEALTPDGIPSPSAYDRARNRHRDGIAWSKGAVRVDPANPRYTGHQVWNKQRKDEVLHRRRRRRPRPRDPDAVEHPDDWIWSDRLVHDPAHHATQFEAVQDLLAAAGRRAVDRKPTAHRPPIRLSSLIFCGLCQPPDAGQLEQRQGPLPVRLPDRVRPGQQGRPSPQPLRARGD